jgi:hypothetical protein
MQRHRFLMIALILALAVVGTASAAEFDFRAKLTGSQEVPPNNSVALGHAAFTLSPDGTRLYYRLTVQDIANVTQAHIHVGPPGMNGPVVLFLYPSAPPPVLIPGIFNGVLGRGFAEAGDLVGPMAGQPLSVLLEAIESGGAYVNVHTLQLPGGEIRGQIE